MQEPQPMDWETYKKSLPKGQAHDLTGEDESVDMRDQPGAKGEGAD